MNKELVRFLSFLGATAAFALTIAVVGSRFLSAAGGPDGVIITRLKQLEQRGVEYRHSWAVLLGPKVRFQRISVVLDADGQAATVTSTLDFTGELRRPSGPQVTRVSSLGLERARYRLKEGEWEPETSDFPRLLGILDALEARRRELDRSAAPGELDGLGVVLTSRAYRSLAWYIRSEREEVLVSEDSQLTGDSPERPIDLKVTRQLSLLEDGQGLFSFPTAIR